jgi:hypothetical protein
MSANKEASTRSSSCVAPANDALWPALSGHRLRLTITPPYLDPNSHEALYEIDVTALA